MFTTQGNLEIIYGCQPKNRGGISPKMDGENNGKPYEQMDDFGVFPYFGKHPYIYIYFFFFLTQSSISYSLQNNSSSNRNLETGNPREPLRQQPPSIIAVLVIAPDLHFPEMGVSSANSTGCLIQWLGCWFP